MPKFYCEYCGIYLTHSSPSGRAQHSKGRKHIQNRVEYYRQIIQDITMDQEKNKDGFFNNVMMPNLMQGGQLQPIQMHVPGIPGMPHNILQNQSTSLQQGGIKQISITSSLPTNQQIQGMQPQSIQPTPINLLNPQMPQFIGQFPSLK